MYLNFWDGFCFSEREKEKLNVKEKRNVVPKFLQKLFQLEWEMHINIAQSFGILTSSTNIRLMMAKWEIEYVEEFYFEVEEVFADVDSVAQ